MNWQKVFIHDGLLRPIWRFLLSAVMIGLAYVGVAIVLGLAFGMAGARPQLLAVLFAVNALLLPTLLFVFWILTAVFEARPLSSVGLAFGECWRGELALGLLVGAAMAVAVAAAQGLLRLTSFSLAAHSFSGMVVGGVFVLFLLLLGAVNEELVFRGYAFQRLVDCLGPATAVVVISVLFALAHLGNPSRTWVSTLNTMLVGFPLAVAYLRTRTLWLPIGIHFSWNFFQGYALGFPVSGIMLPTSLLRAQSERLPWMSGGDYGPEGGLIASIVIIAATLYVSFSRRIYISDGVRALVFGPEPLEVNPSGASLSFTGHEGNRDGSEVK